MTIDLTPQELELVLRALKDRVARLLADGQTATELERLIAKLEVDERSARYGPRPG
jgi:hypothetical protein